MKRVATFLAGVAGVALMAMLLPANALANCPNLGQQSFTLCFGGGEVILGPDSGALAGEFWMQGAGNDAIDAGIDSGIWSGATADGNWVLDFGLDIPGTRCLEWDWGAANTDGCPDGATPVWAVVTDSANAAMVVSKAGVGGAGAGIYDFSFSTNGSVAPNFGGAGLALGRAVHVSSASTSVGDVTVNVAALAVPRYDETGGARALPGTAQLRGTNGGPVVVPGAGAKAIVVDQDTDLCWEIVDGSYTATLGCVRVGGLTPSQNLQNAKATFGRGQMNFSWEVSAQFDVLGFNVIQKNASKNTEVKVNDTLIPINGMNDAQAASYSFSAGRKDLKATRGGFEIEMVRLNGETSRIPAPLR